MKKLLFLLLPFLCFSSFVKMNDTEDFLDYWRISYNKTLLLEARVIKIQEISIRIKDIKPTDFLIIEYFRGTPCSKCECYV